MPNKVMSQSSADVTGIQIKNNKIYVRQGDSEKEVPTSSPRDGFFSFLHFLKKHNKPCILLAHNCFKFDTNRLIKLSITLGLFKEFK